MKSMLPRTALSAVSTLALMCSMTGAGAEEVPVGTADGYAILAGTTITNTGATVITGNVGLNPGTAITGFTFSGPPGPGLVIGEVHAADAVAIQAKSDLVIAYQYLAGLPATIDLTGQDLGGLVLNAGVYHFNSSAGLTGTLTLDAQGNPNAVFVIDIGSTLTTASGANVVLVNGAQAGNVFFRVGSSATLGTNTTFNGTIVALTSITLTTGADITCGAAWARNGAVTLDTNTITVCPLITATISDVLGPDLTENQTEVADAIDAIIEGGTLPIEFQVLLAFLTPEQLAFVATQLTGEAGTTVAPAGMAAMDRFLGLVMNPYRYDRGSSPTPLTQPAPNDNTVTTMGYAAVPGTPAAIAAVEQMDRTAPDPRGLYIWAEGYGGITNAGGSPSAGSHDRFAQTYGFAIGIDDVLSPNATVGLAIGLGATGFHLSDDLGGGQSRTLQAAAHTRLEFGQAYLAAGIAYAWHAVTTDRTITGIGTTRLIGQYSAHNVGGQIEAGYRLGGDRASVTPYAAVGVQAFFTPTYTETAVSGAQAFALTYDARTTIAVRTELGARTERTFSMAGGTDLTLRGGLAWVHEAWSNTAMTAAFATIPGSTFTVEGAAPPANALLYSVGASINFAGGFAIGASFDGELARGARSYAVTARMSFSW